MDLLPAVDAHHHLWDLEANSYPWLTTERDAIPIPNFESICRNYLVPDFRADVANQNIVKSVHVQAEHDESDPVRETAWLQSVADDPASDGFPHGIVAFADLSESASEVEAILSGHREFANLRGIRQSLNRPPPSAEAEQDTQVADAGKDLLSDPVFLENFSLLRKYDLSFDIQLFPWQWQAGRALMAAHPDIPFVVNHTGFPMDRSDDGLNLWDDAMRGYAELPHVMMKISGLAMGANGWEGATSQWLVDATLEIFGVERCFFASNFPVDKLFADYDTEWNCFRDAIAGLSRDEQTALLRTNAERFYRI